MLTQNILKTPSCSHAAPASAQEGGHWPKVQAPGLRCGASVAPPYVMPDPATREYTGFFADLCRELGTRLEVKPEFVDSARDNSVAGCRPESGTCRWR